MQDTTRPLHVQVAEALGWRRIGSQDHCKPLHKPSLDWPGRMVSDWESKGPHERLENPDHSGSHYFCGCENTSDIPQFDTDWAATGPLIEKYGISLRSPNEPEPVGGNFWEAYSWHGEECIAGGRGPLIAVCRLILKLKEAGKL